MRNSTPSFLRILATALAAFTAVLSSLDPAGPVPGRVSRLSDTTLTGRVRGPGAVPWARRRCRRWQRKVLPNHYARLYALRGPENGGAMGRTARFSRRELLKLGVTAAGATLATGCRSFGLALAPGADVDLSTAGQLAYRDSL